MLGNKWMQAMATVVEVRGHQGELPPPGSGPVLGLRALREYVIETRDPNGSMLRTTVSEDANFVYPVGCALPVNVNFKTGEAKIDVHAVQRMTDQMMQHRYNAASGIGGAPGGYGSLGALGNLPGVVADAIAAAGVGASAVHVINQGGQAVPFNSAQANELRQLTRALLSGDPAAKQAAASRLQQLKAELRQQSGVADYQAPGSTSGPGGQAGTAGSYGGQAPGASLGQPFTTISVTEMGSDQFGQVVQPPYGPPSGFDQFGAGTGQATVEQRLARLQDLYSKGVLTESEYQARRQQIINEI